MAFQSRDLFYQNFPLIYHGNWTLWTTQYDEGQGQRLIIFIGLNHNPQIKYADDRT